MLVQLSPWLERRVGCDIRPSVKVDARLYIECGPYAGMRWAGDRWLDAWRTMHTLVLVLARGAAGVVTGAGLLVRRSLHRMARWRSSRS